MTRNPWREWTLVAGPLLVPLLFAGCAAFENRAVITIKEEALEDGARVVLSKQVVSDAFSRAEYLKLELVEEGACQDYTARIPDGIAEENLVLCIDQPKRRAWVLDRREAAALFSVDFANGRAWDDKSDQPPWALTK
jgi:hypothetical protein